MLPDDWIEKLFRKLEDFYGAKWAAQYGNFPRDRVKKTWAEELGGFFDQPERIAYAINLVKENPFPPTLPEFIGFCRQAPRKEPAALPHKPTAEDAARLKEMAKRASEALDARYSGGRDHRGWAKLLRERYLAGEKLSAIQQRMASDALGEVWMSGACSPVPAFEEAA